MRVELKHILKYPVGHSAFQKFCEAEFSAENLLFLTAVDKYDELCMQYYKQFVGAMGGLRTSFRLSTSVRTSLSG